MVDLSQVKSHHARAIIGYPRLVALLFGALMMVNFKGAGYENILPAAEIFSIILLFGIATALIAHTNAIITFRKVPAYAVGSLVVIFCWSLFTAIPSEESFVSLTRIIVILPITLMLLIFSSSVTDPLQFFLKLASAVVHLVFFVSMLAIVLYFLGQTGYIAGSRMQIFDLGPIRISQVTVGIPPILRTGGYFGNPNTLSVWIIVSISLLFFLRKVKIISRQRFAIFLIVYCIGMIITFSRTGILVSLASMILFILMTRRSAVAVISAISIIAISLIFALQYVLGNLEETGRLSASLNDRDLVWLTLIRSISERPFLGVGFGVSSEVIISKGASEISQLSAHNFYLMILSEIGIFAGGASIFLLLLPVASSYRQWVRSSRSDLTKSTSGAIFVLFLSVAIISLTEAYILRFTPISFLFVLVFAFTQQKIFWEQINARGSR